MVDFTLFGLAGKFLACEFFVHSRLIEAIKNNIEAYVWIKYFTMVSSNELT